MIIDLFYNEIHRRRNGGGMSCAGPELVCFLNVCAVSDSLAGI